MVLVIAKILLELLLRLLHLLHLQDQLLQDQLLQDQLHGRIIVEMVKETEMKFVIGKVLVIGLKMDISLGERT